MPKIKTHSGAKKRFSLTKTGKIKHRSAYKSHRLNNIKKSPSRRRRLRKDGYVDVSNEAVIKQLIPYK